MTDSTTQTKTFDPQEILARYEAEKAKRVRTDHEEQFIEAVGEYEEFVEDPYIETPLNRDGITKDIEVAVIGGGFGGLLTAVELLDRGIDDLHIIEQAGDFGGTWYWNRYPGIRCDIEAYVYMPLLEEVGTIPSERYASGLEIFEHAKAIGRHYNLYDRALFQTKVESIVWDESLNRWIVKTNQGDTIRARYVSVSQGPLAKVKLPKIPGINEFKGKKFHSARWDYDYTGGDINGNLHKLKDKRIAVIGTGATAIQIVPKLVDSCKELLLFQRTPSAIAPRNNTKTDEEWLKSQPKGWQKERIFNFLTNITPGAHPTSDIVNDGWTDFFKRVGAAIGAAKKSGKPFTPNEVFQEVDFEKMEELRARIPEIVGDPEAARIVTPWYNYLCKRPLFSDDFLECLNSENLTIIDTDGKGVTHIDETSVHANDQAFEVDCVIFATGFDVAAAAHKVGGYDLIGRGGVSIDEAWSDGQRTVHGTQMNGFPNFHVVGAVAQGTTIFNFTTSLQMQATHAAEIIKKCRDKGAVMTEVTREAEDHWLEIMKHPHAIDLRKYYLDCTPGFLNNEGDIDSKNGFLDSTFGAGPIEYEKKLKEWRDSRFEMDTNIKK